MSIDPTNSEPNSGSDKFPEPFLGESSVLPSSVPEESLGLDSDFEYAHYRRMKVVPAILFLLTLASTFFVGVNLWNPLNFLNTLVYYFDPNAVLNGNLSPLLELRKMLLSNWHLGLTYMGCVVLILLLHEMGHFVATLIYRVPASFPIFLPFPINPIGTLGAVIAMHGMAANRKQIFDIGLAGPLAGLIAAVPIAWFGVSQLDLTTPTSGGIGFRLPLLMQWFASYAEVSGYAPGKVVWISQLNPMFVAGWVGFLITGFNMMPIGQLDGGHVTYTLFGKGAHAIAKITITLIIAFMVYHANYLLLVMVTLLLLVGAEHPPTRDDEEPLGAFRFGLGLISLAIPILCFPPMVFQINQ